jgi:hypothetical protein
MGWVEMSERELRRAEVLASVLAGGLTMTAAAGLMGITRRQAHHLARQFAEHGAAGLRHRARGRPSNRGLGPHVRQMAIAYVTENYRDFGPTLASQINAAVQSGTDLALPLPETPCTTAATLKQTFCNRAFADD